MAAESLASKPPQPSGQDRRPGFQWTRRLTPELISARSENDGLFQDINWRKKSAWNRISQRIAVTFPDEELHPSAEQCENRWKNLMKAYKAYVDSQQKTGADRKQPPAFYDEMNSTFGWKPNIHPKFWFLSLDPQSVQLNCRIRMTIRMVKQEYHPLRPHRNLLQSVSMLQQVHQQPWQPLPLMMRSA